MVLFCALVLSPAFAENQTKDAAKDFLNNYSELLEQNFSSSQAFGSPIEAGDYVVIPVVCKITGFGFGTKLKSKNVEGAKEQEGKMQNHEGRLGLGGGAVLKPIALIFVNKSGGFEVVNLNEGFFAQLGKSMAPAMANVVKETIKKLFKYKMKKMQSKKPYQKKK
jgi:uncharacterized spore protein YtfJ